MTNAKRIGECGQAPGRKPESSLSSRGQVAALRTAGGPLRASGAFDLAALLAFLVPGATLESTAHTCAEGPKPHPATGGGGGGARVCLGGTTLEGWRVTGGRARAFSPKPALFARESKARPERNAQVERAQQLVLLSRQRHL